jgi:hypothetical protein
MSPVSAAWRDVAGGDRNAELSNANESQEEGPLRLKYSNPPTIINHILLNTAGPDITPVSVAWRDVARRDATKLQTFPQLPGIRILYSHARAN